MPRICVFDVNETLLDLRALDAQFARVFGDANLRQAWFTQMLQNAFVATITGPYRDFGTLGAAALAMVADRLGVAVGDLRLIAAHAWDIAGALRAGCAAAFVARPGMVLDPLVERPDVVGADLREVAERIVEREGG